MQGSLINSPTQNRVPLLQYGYSATKVAFEDGNSKNGSEVEVEPDGSMEIHVLASEPKPPKPEQKPGHEAGAEKDLQQELICF